MDQWNIDWTKYLEALFTGKNSQNLDRWQHEVFHPKLNQSVPMCAIPVQINGVWTIMDMAQEPYALLKDMVLKSVNSATSATNVFLEGVRESNVISSDQPLAVHDINGVVALSHPGKVRDFDEDSIFVGSGSESRIEYTDPVTKQRVSAQLTDDSGQPLITTDGEEALGHVTIVADGMGGHGSGEIASKLAILAFVQSCYGNPDMSLSIEVRIKAAVQEANSAINTYNKAKNTNSGTTFVGSVTMPDGTAYVINVGDTRAYKVDASGKVTQITKDHSLVQSMIDARQLKESERRRHPQKNQIYKSLGGKNATPDIFTEKVAPGEKILLMCDGLWEMVEDATIESILRGGAAKDAVSGLIAAANTAGGEDNITAVLVGEPVVLSPRGQAEQDIKRLQGQIQALSGTASELAQAQAKVTKAEAEQKAAEDRLDKARSRQAAKQAKANQSQSAPASNVTVPAAQPASPTAPVKSPYCSRKFLNCSCSRRSVGHAYGGRKEGKHAPRTSSQRYLRSARHPRDGDRPRFHRQRDLCWGQRDDLC